MPSPGAGHERWRSLGRLLPQDVRERVFDPAFSDLIYAWLTTAEPGRRVPFGVQAVGTYVGCFPMAIPRLFVRGGRLTRLGRLTVWTLAVLGVLILAVSQITEAYAPYATG